MPNVYDIWVFFYTVLYHPQRKAICKPVLPPPSSFHPIPPLPPPRVFLFISEVEKIFCEFGKKKWTDRDTRTHPKIDTPYFQNQLTLIKVFKDTLHNQFWFPPTPSALCHLLITYEVPLQEDKTGMKWFRLFFNSRTRVRWWEYRWKTMNYGSSPFKHSC